MSQDRIAEYRHPRRSPRKHMPSDDRAKLVLQLREPEPIEDVEAMIAQGGRPTRPPPVNPPIQVEDLSAGDPLERVRLTARLRYFTTEFAAFLANDIYVEPYFASQVMQRCKSLRTAWPIADAIAQAHEWLHSHFEVQKGGEYRVQGHPQFITIVELLRALGEVGAPQSRLPHLAFLAHEELEKSYQALAEERERLERQLEGAKTDKRTSKDARAAIYLLGRSRGWVDEPGRLLQDLEAEFEKLDASLDQQGLPPSPYTLPDLKTLSTWLTVGAERVEAPLTKRGRGRPRKK